MMLALPPFLAHIGWIARQIEEVMAQKPQAEALLNQFPRDMAVLASAGLDIPVFYLPELSVHRAQTFLCMLSGELFHSSIEDRPLSGLLHMGPPSNVIFIRKGLPSAWANYISAHEIGHFFADVLLIQQQWLHLFPEQEYGIREFFSWYRSDDWLALQGVIRGLPHRPKPILARGRNELPETARREQQADLIALELLAPWQMVVPLFVQYGSQAFVQLLCKNFGLPLQVATSYRFMVETTVSPHGDLIDRLFGPLLQDQNENKK